MERQRPERLNHDSNSKNTEELQTTKRVIEFGRSNEDTCMKHWTFTLQENADHTIITSIKINPSAEKCAGHPKTIMARVRNTPLQALDLQQLAKTNCVRTTSCGMNLAESVAAIQESGKESK